MGWLLEISNQGRWIKGISLHIGFSTNYSAELWIFRVGIHLALELGFKFTNLDINSALAINWQMSYDVVALDLASI